MNLVSRHFPREKWLYVISFIIAIIVSVGLFFLLPAGMEKAQNLLIISPIIFIVPFALSKIETNKLVSFLLLFYWLPFNVFVLSDMNIFETALWALLIIQIGEKYILRKEKAYVFQAFPYKPFLLFIAGALLTYLITFHKGSEVSIIRYYCILPLLLNLVLFINTRGFEDANRNIKMVLFSSVALSLLFSFGSSWTRYITSSEYGLFSARRSMSMNIPHFGAITILQESSGTLFGYMLLIAFAYWLRANRMTQVILYSVICIIFGYAIILGQGRTGIISFTIASIFLTLLNPGRGPRRKNLIRSLLMIGAFVTGVFIYYQRSGSSELQYRAFDFARSPLQDQNLIGRTRNWEIGWETFVEKPWGVGLNGFPFQYAPDSSDSTWSVHNLWLYILLSFGPLGLAGFLWILIRINKKFIKCLNSPEPEKIYFAKLGLAATVYIIASSMGSNLIYSPFTSILHWAPIAICYAGVKES
jgi:O-antigen ligase